MIEQALLTSGSSAILILLFYLIKHLINKLKSDSTKNTNTNNITISPQTQNNELRMQRELVEVKKHLEALETRLNHLIKAFSIYVGNNGSDKETKELIKKLLDDFI